VKPRRHKRRHLIYYLRVFENGSEKLVGHVVDITQEGLKLIMDSPITPKSKWKLRMSLPEPIEGTREVRFEATCVWCDKDVNPDFYVAGFEIHGLGESEIQTIESLVREFGFQD